MLFLVFAVLAILMATVFYIDRELRFEQQKTVEKQLVEDAARSIVNDINEVYADLHYLSQQSTAKDFLLDLPDVSLSELCQEYLTFSKDEKHYSQIRLLDVFGQEIVRIERENDHSFRVNPDKLQNKSDRYYFREAEKLNVGEVFQSPFDLNVEHGEIVIPYKPTIRFVTPVLGYGGEIIGYMVFNYDGSALLQNLRKLSESTSSSSLFMLNKDGYFLYGASEDRFNWGFMQGEMNAQNNMSKQNPDLWSEINEKTEGFVTQKHKELYTFTRICSENKCGLKSNDTSLGIPFKASDLPWFIVAKSESNWVYGSDFTWQKQWPFIVAALLFVVAFLSFVVSSRLSNTVQRLANRERALEQSKNTFRTLFDFAPDSICIVNPQGIIEMVNHQARKLFEKKPEELVGQDYRNIMPENMQAKFKSFEGRLKSEGEVIEDSGDGILRYQRSKGDERLLEMIVSSVEIEDQPMVLVLIRDLTEKIKTDNQLRQVQKLESLGRLTGGVAHDFNNLLGIVIGQLDLLERGIDDREKTIARVNKVRKAALLASDLTQKLLAVSRKQALKFEPVNLNELLDDVVDMLHRTMKDHITIQSEIAENLPIVEADSSELVNALINLAVNAKDALQDGGEIYIGAEVVGAGEVCSQGPDEAILPGDYVSIEVADNGTGIPASILERILEPFFSTKPKEKGSGLGLSMVYGLIKQVKGHLCIESVEGKGTSVHLYLPVMADSKLESFDKPVEEVMLESILAEEEMGIRRLLVIDDEEDLLEVTEAYLSQAGYQCVTARSADEAWGILESGERFDLVVSDVIMPGHLDGFELMKKMQKEGIGLPFVFVSGFSESLLDLQHDRVQNSGFILIHKPFTKQQLVEAVKELLSIAV